MCALKLMEERSEESASPALPTLRGKASERPCNRRSIGSRSSNRGLEGLPGIGNCGLQAPHCVRERRSGRSVAPRPSGGLPSQALVARHPPGSEPGRSSGLLSRRVHLSLQPPHIPIPRVVVLPTDRAGSEPFPGKGQKLGWKSSFGASHNI